MARRIQLRGARTLLTGASGGIGTVLARRLSAEGAELILSGRRKEVLDALASELGAQAIVCDLAEPGAAEQLLAQAGRVDILIANAALPGTGWITTLDPAHIDRALTVNLRAPIFLAKGLVPQMIERRSGHLVFIGSLSSKAATPGSSVYAATKFGLRGFALALRAELARNRIGVSLVLPGFVSETGMYADAGVRLPPGAGTRSPDEVAETVVRAIRENRGEVVVATRLMRAGATFASLAPNVAARGARLVGAERVTRNLERGQAGKR